MRFLHEIPPVHDWTTISFVYFLFQINGTDVREASHAETISALESASAEGNRPIQVQMVRRTCENNNDTGSVLVFKQNGWPDPLLPQATELPEPEFVEEEEDDILIPGLDYEVSAF